MKLDGYESIVEISRGPITTVLRARQTALDRPVLIKTLNSQWLRDRELVERFHREALICARLKHPNIINIFDVVSRGETLYMIIEYVDGLALDDCLRRHHPFPFALLQTIASGILAGLEYAHGQNVVHRDIKPANILLSNDGQVKLVDFGLATRFDLPAITAQDGTVGTPAYMAPEQIRGERTTGQSDLFSTGATLYELASGESPFLGENVGQTLQNVLTGKTVSLHKKRPDLPEWFGEMIRQMLEKDPHHRPASASDIVQSTPLQDIIPDQLLVRRLLKGEIAVESANGAAQQRQSRPRPRRPRLAA